ncbi:PIH1 domain-containing protein 1 [Cebus imitator]|uniref:PIH1 domain-containing protein 1 n=1 Tax=Cebus imitator TaxID=2715852 RepID=UPI00080A6FE3|nr:PIH1 domain-containing protein 1 [Cebus imitator]
MANPKQLALELSEAETMGADSARFEELLLQASKELQQAQTTRPESTQIQPQPGEKEHPEREGQETEGKKERDMKIKAWGSGGVNRHHQTSPWDRKEVGDRNRRSFWDQALGSAPGISNADSMFQKLRVTASSSRFLMSLCLCFLRLLSLHVSSLSGSGLWAFCIGLGGSHPLFLPAEGQGCTAYDVAVNSDFYRRMQNSDFLRELVITIAREGLEDKYNLQLNPEWRMMKNRPFMGSISQQNIRSRQRPRIQELGDLYTSTPGGAESGPEKPHLSLWLEAPDLLLAEIDLPKLDGALGLSLEIGENRLVMGGPQQLYHLDAYIPLRINSDESKAAFHWKRKQLMVAMPLLSLPS